MDCNFRSDNYNDRNAGLLCCVPIPRQQTGRSPIPQSGTTTVRQEFQNRTRDILTDRAEFMRMRLQDFREHLDISTIELGSDARLPGDYAAGHAMGVSYDTTNLPDEPTLVRDLRQAVRAYRALTFRGGLSDRYRALGQGRFRIQRSR